MIKMHINGTVYYVGDGVELRRIWRKAVYQKGYYSYYVDEPRYNISGTYCLTFDKGEIHWDNFNKIVREGEQHFNKKMPSYQCYHWVENGLADARFNYESNKFNRKYRF